ncbi:hypothetical protein BpHYR1_023746 [Brachionus plicatilis]|uniref:Uncharacterized protein n=1 Tax=Brachionus plicatilis TaxID=10195 RepID=A0A3M7RQW3_BRAPC|nr:hypothetical protein BpHYR1_023746 [Brachionus plicatilis]
MTNLVTNKIDEILLYIFVIRNELSEAMKHLEKHQEGQKAQFPILNNYDPEKYEKFCRNNDFLKNPYETHQSSSFIELPFTGRINSKEKDD